MRVQSKLNKGFTLIELLVVIAIIAILAAILFPVFAQAKKAAKQTQDISNLKNINTGVQIYLNDYDDTWPIWTTGADCFFPGNNCAATSLGASSPWDDGSAFGLKYMYPQIINPYIKSGVGSSATNANLTDIWASPLSKGYFPQTKYLYSYNYYALGGFSSCIASNITSASSCRVGRSASWGPFQDAGYNTPAAASSLSNPASTIALMDGNILARAPQFFIGFTRPTGYAVFAGVWGPYNPGDGAVGVGTNPILTASAALADYNTNAGCPCANPRDQITTADFNLLTGDRTIVSYTDSHVKSVNTPTILSNKIKTNKWTGALTDNTGWTR